MKLNKIVIVTELNQLQKKKKLIAFQKTKGSAV